MRYLYKQEFFRWKIYRTKHLVEKNSREKYTDGNDNRFYLIKHNCEHLCKVLE